jgi:hypothetical protein
MLPLSFRGEFPDDLSFLRIAACLHLAVPKILPSG